MPTTTKSPGFSDAEKAAMKARAEEMRASGRGGAKKADEAQACLDAIAAMPEEDRVLAERVHTIVAEAAPDTRPKTWYGMPAYVDADGKVVCFFKPASKFGARYATLGFNDVAALDDGEIWPTEYAVTSASPAVAETIERIVRKAVGSTD
ncbi:iron chaperone [Microlunatus ginsengisoli]|uniref:YdhG-like domain-containing protein n=1 Tax=Microlunatus ginsengisoli TaxID=363863 RepID=A0ABP6ZF45_9ACTN